MRGHFVIFALLVMGCAGEKSKTDSRFFTPATYGEAPKAKADAATPAPIDVGTPSTDVPDTAPEYENFWGVEDRPLLTSDLTYEPPSGVDTRSDTRLNIAYLLPLYYENRARYHIAWLADKTRRKYLRVHFEERPDLDRVFDITWIENATRYYHLPWGPNTRMGWTRDITGLEIDLDPPPGELRDFLKRFFTIKFTIFEPDTRCSHSQEALIDFSDSRHERISERPENVDWSDACAHL